MIHLNRGAQVTAQYLTTIFAKMYRKVNLVGSLSLASTGQYLVEGSIVDPDTSERAECIMEPMSTSSSQYFDDPVVTHIRDSRRLRPDSSYDFMARYREDVANIRKL